jgi:hypothetical protein
MAFILQPWQLYLAILAGWLNRQQQEVIEYLRTENRVLKEKLGKKRILLNDDQRRRLAVKGKILGRKPFGQNIQPTSKPLENTGFTLARDMNLRRRSEAS